MTTSGIVALLRALDSRCAVDLTTLYSVKNNRQLGPAPATARRAPRLSPSRAALLETLRTRTEPTTLDALANLAGLHPNTVREHLDALVDGGFVTRFSAEPSGRG